MIRILLLAWTLLVCAATAQERPDVVHDISGQWRSSTGVTIHIPAYEDPEHSPTFVFRVRPRNGPAYSVKASWRTGFRQGFTYGTSTGDTIYAVVDRDGETISLGNENQDWKAVWTRAKP
jgi:hypothetical protein